MQKSKLVFAQSHARRGHPLAKLFAFLALFGLVSSVAAPLAFADTGFTDVNPDKSDLDPTDPDGASGGRVNGLAAVAGDNQTFYAASEWGGIYKSTNGGVNWSFLAGHRPLVTWDVDVDPSSTQRVYATSFYDGRLSSVSGINVSTNGGASWTRPATATPPGGYNCAAARVSEPSAFGIGIRPDATNNVFIGTNCGVAFSTDSGATWTFVDPTPATPATDVWDVVVQGGGPTGQGIVDVCGDDGHFRSTNGGGTWTGGTGGLPGGTCSIAVSPDESYVLFVVVGTRIFESDDSGATWPTEFANPSSQGRVPFVVTNQRSDSAGTNRFDLWFGDISLHRAGCTTPASPALGGAARCPGSGSWAGPFTRFTAALPPPATQTAHDDAGDLVFDTQAANDACPRIFSSDGGVYRNTDTGSDCQNPKWEQPNVTPHATWLFALAGANRAGDTGEDLYFGLQDDGSWGTTNAGATPPTWTNRDCCDVFDFVADANRVVYTLCCFAAPGTRMFIRGPGLSGGGQIAVASRPPGTFLGFRPMDALDRFADKQYVVVTTAGVFITTDITAGTISWTQLGAASSPANACAVRAADTAGSPGTPTFYVQAGICNERTMALSGDQLWRYTGTAPGGTWTRIDNNGGQTGGIGIFAVDPANSNRLYASNMRSAGLGGPRMVFSTDGGTTWNPDPELDTFMTGSGVFRYSTQRGPSNFTQFRGYPQPTLLAYDPENTNILVAGGRDSGVFISTNGGADWGLLTDPFNSHVSGVPHLPRPWFAYFDHEPAGTINIYVGTQGRGVWRVRVRLPTASAGGPYTTDEGTNVTLDASASTDPGGATLSFAWDLDNDGDFDDATGANPVFDRVGQDGVFTVRVKVSAGGAFSIAQTTVTVNNVAPTVTLSSDAPKPENSSVQVSGAVSDPGWLDPLTATVDWGDGTGVQPLSGTLENVRPDATFTFSATHVYGDNGTFTATVCGSDDDTTTCQTIALAIGNVAPTAAIDESGAVVVNGTPTFIAHAGETLTFSGRVTDPGSDDETVTWDWGDGPPSPDVTTIYLVNAPATDPFPSPTVQPRDITDTKQHAFAQACFYVITFAATDDDGGTGSDSANVVIVGNATGTRSAGYWHHQYKGQGSTDFTTAELNCYLAIVSYMSQVFNEVRDASTIAKAEDVLFVNQNRGTASALFDRQLLAAWLNFANGAIGYGQLVDTNGDGTPDAPFSSVVGAAEAVRLDPSATAAQVLAQKDILERINLRDE